MIDGLRLLLSALVLSTGLGCSDDPTANDDAAQVPDPCGLVAAGDISAILGSDPGEGALGAADPAQRKICTYDSGLILAVEVAENWDVSIDLMRDVAPLEAVSGLGEQAWWQDVGGNVGQLVARDGDYFVGVTIVGGKDAATAIAERMLDAL